MSGHEELLRDIQAWANGDTEAQQTFRRVWGERLAAVLPRCSACGDTGMKDVDLGQLGWTEEPCECGQPQDSTAEPPTCAVPGCHEPATEEIYGQRVCRKHLALWSA